MCRQNAVLFTRCGHSAQTLTICGFNGFVPPQPCAHVWGGILDERDELCKGCHAVHQLQGFDHAQAKSSIKILPMKMPFSYVVYGQLPSSHSEGRESTTAEDKLVRVMGYGTDPLEELVSKLSLSERQDACTPEGFPHEEKTRTSPFEKSSPPSSLEVAASPQHHKKPSANRVRGDTFNRPQRHGRAPSRPAPSHLAQSPFPPLTSKALHRLSHSSKRSKRVTRPEEKPSYTSCLASATSAKPQSTQRNVKRRVRFAHDAEVQYFRGDFAPIFVRNCQDKAQGVFAVEPVPRRKR